MQHVYTVIFKSLKHTTHMFISVAQSVPKPADAKPAAETKSASPAAAGDSRKTSKITIVPSQPKSDKNAGQPPAPAPSKARENGRPEPSSRPQLERQTRVERSRSRGDQIPLSKSESTTGKFYTICFSSLAFIRLSFFFLITPVNSKL